MSAEIRTAPARSSLRRSVLVTLLAVVVPIVALLSVLLFLTVRTSIWDRFDADLVDTATNMAALVEYDEDGYEFGLGAHPQPLTTSPGYRTEVGLWTPDGAVLATSTPGLRIPSGVTEGRAVEVGQGDARRRVVVLRFAPAIELDARAGVPASDDITLLVSREVAGTQNMLQKIGAWFLGLGLVTLGCAAFAASWSVRRGLAPVAEFTRSIANIDDQVLSRRVDPRALPPELVPVARRINELLDRLEGAFDRERRFSADVAHELRTPLAVLQAELELGLRRERSAPEYAGALARGLETVREVSTLVQRLFGLARLERGGPLESQDVALRPLVLELWAEHANTARDRRLEFRVDIAAERVLSTDPQLFRVIVSNLLGNAVVYTDEGGWIEVRSGGDEILAVVDSGPSLSAEDRVSIFDRFARLDSARSEVGEHAGLGLSIVRAACERLGYRVSAQDDAKGALAFVVREEPSTGSIPA